MAEHRGDRQVALEDSYYQVDEQHGVQFTLANLHLAQGLLSHEEEREQRPKEHKWKEELYNEVYSAEDRVAVEVTLLVPLLKMVEDDFDATWSSKG